MPDVFDIAIAEEARATSEFVSMYGYTPSYEELYEFMCDESESEQLVLNPSGVFVA